MDSAQTPKAVMRKSSKLICFFFAAAYLNSEVCAGIDKANGLGQSFGPSDLQSLATKEAIALYSESVINDTPSLIESVKTTILSKYTLVNGVY